MFLGLGHIDGLQKKVRGLEEENLTLRCQTAQLKVDTCDLEEKEEKLVKDAVRQLADINGQIQALQEEVFSKTELTFKQQEEITTLMGKVIALESQIKRVSWNLMVIRILLSDYKVVSWVGDLVVISISISA